MPIVALKPVLWKKVFNKPTDINIGEISKVIAEDAGAMIPIKPLNVLLQELKDGGSKKPVLHLGESSGNLVMNVQDVAGLKTHKIIVKGYAKLKEDRKKVAVINAQKGDKVIDSSTDRMAKAKGVTAQDADKADVSSVKGDIVLLAHGANVGKSPGQVYAKSFGDKSASDIVKYLVKTKKLPLAYSGTVYLDGCYTAAGPKKGRGPGELNNFCKKVYDGLVKAGYERLQVKGNLGLAATLEDGSEKVTDAQVEKELELATKTLNKQIKDLESKMTALNGKMLPLIKEKKALEAQVKTVTDAKEKAKLDSKLKATSETLAKCNTAATALLAKTNTLRDQRRKVTQPIKDKYGLSADAIQDLVGTFGPEKPMAV